MTSHPQTKHLWEEVAGCDVQLPGHTDGVFSASHGATHGEQPHGGATHQDLQS